MGSIHLLTVMLTPKIESNIKALVKAPPMI
jgi:hypothetical protein